MLTKDHIDTLVLIVVACALGATVWYYASERSAAEQAPPKEYVVCVLDEDKNPTDCVPYDDFVSEDAPSRSKRIVNRCLLKHGVGFTTCLPDPVTPAPWHPATGLGVCASCLSCLLVLISPFYEHRPYRIATAETRVLEDKT